LDIALEGGTDTVIRGPGETVQGVGVEVGGHDLAGSEDEEITSADGELRPRPPLTKPLAAGLSVCADTVSQVRL
jgi:hypothetical protein